MPRKTKGETMSAALNLSIVDQITAANASDSVEAEALNSVNLSVTSGGVQSCNDVEIYDDVPVPTGRAARQSAYPFAALNKGQSFFVPATDVDQNKLLIRMSAACSARNKKGEAKFITRKWTGKAGQLGAMVWRTV